MTNGSQGPTISDDELLYRRIPKSMKWYHPGEPVEVDDEAFRPHKVHDTTGLSLQRARSTEHSEFLSADEFAAQGRSESGYVIAVLSVENLRTQDIHIEPRPLEGNPGHVEL